MLERFFNAKSVAIIGASDTPGKVGNVILKNFLNAGFSGKIYPVNQNQEEMLGLKCYRKVLDIKNKVELAIIAVPAQFVPGIIEQCGIKGIKNAIIISGGFGETGNFELEKQLKETLKKYNIQAIGPNCIGVFNSKSKIDSVFFPQHKLKRPGFGKVSIISQSGGIGLILLSMSAEQGIGINKLISYGNAYNLDESDFLRFLANDKSTKTIILYIEGITNGKKFINALEYANRKKPVVILKAGKYGEAIEAAKTHTGAIAGNYTAYKAVFRKAKAIEAETLQQLFDLLMIFSQPLPKGKNIGIITNGGGLGVMCTDSVIKQNLNIAQLGESEKEKIKKFLPDYATPANPLDLVADAGIERYAKALESFEKNEDIHMIVINVLFQSPAVDDTLLNVILSNAKFGKKPIIAVVPGGGSAKLFRENLSMNNVPAFEDPDSAVFCLKKLYEYKKFREKK